MNALPKYALATLALVAIGAGVFFSLGHSPTTPKTDAVTSNPAGKTDWYQAVTAEIARSEYFITFDEGAKTLQSPNRKHNMRFSYGANSFTVQPRVENPSWSASLRLAAIDKGAASLGVTNNAKNTVRENQLVANHGKYAIEYVNNTDGMRQNFIVNERPEGSDKLTVTLNVEGQDIQLIDEGNDVMVAKASGDETTKLFWYRDLKVWDAEGTILPATMDVAGSTIVIAVNDANAVYPVTVDPLSSIPDWTAGPSQAGAQYGFTFAYADVNNDGFDDVLVGAPRYDNGQVDEGAVFVYHGAVTGASTVATRILESNQAGALFGSAIVGLDLNNDRFEDIVAGAPEFSNGQPQEGAIFTFLGSSTGVSSANSTSRESNVDGARFGAALSSAGRINNDDTLDVLVGAPFFSNIESNEGAAYVYYGGAGGLKTDNPWRIEGNQDGARLGTSVAGGADFNGDGRSDVAVGIPLWSAGQTREGAVWVYYQLAGSGLPNNANWTNESNQENAQYGFSIAVAGDINGDNISELVVGSPLASNGESNEGRAFLYNGATGGLQLAPSWTGESNQTNARYGASVASAGDINGDGNDDVIVGSPFFDSGELDEGRASAYLGSAAGLAQTPIWNADGNQNNALFGSAVATIGDINADGFEDFIVGAPFFDGPGGIDEGRAFAFLGSGSAISGAAGSVEINVINAQLGFSVSGAGDVNRDGFSDVIVGAPFFDGGQVAEGAAYLYLGSRSGIGNASSWRFESNQANAQFGYSVSLAGDLNGDNFGDVVVGAPFFDDSLRTDRGRAYIFWGSGSTTGLPLTAASQVLDGAQAFMNYGWAVACAGDVNGDGFSDIIVGAPNADNGQDDEGIVFIYRGSTQGVVTTAVWQAEANQLSAGFGSSLAGAGDFNGDGFSDIAIGAPRANGDADVLSEGTVSVYYGRSTWPQTTPNWRDTTTQDGAELGAAVAIAGDVDGDGYSDLLIGAPRFDNGQTDEGRVTLFRGSAQGLRTTSAWQAENNRAGSRFGFALGGNADLNGDGFADVVVGAPQYSGGQSNEGAAYVYLGSRSGLSVTPSQQSEGDQVFAWFGYSVAAAGDVNGDGFSDFVVGAPRNDNGQNDEGRVYVFLGRNTGLGLLPNLSLESAQAGSQLGYEMSGIGDINGDGFADVAVAAPYFDTRNTDEGRVFIYNGSANGLATNPSATITLGLQQDNSFFGWSLRGLGDVNGDGFADVAIATPYFDNANRNVIDAGRVNIYHGSATGLPAQPTKVLEGPQSGSLFGFSVAGVGDVNGDGFADLAIGAPRQTTNFDGEGRLYVYYGSGSGITEINPWIIDGGQNDARMGAAIAAAGDVNRDGIQDLLVSAPFRDSLFLDEGRAYVFLGANGGLSTTPAWVKDGGQTQAYYGAAVAGAGDVNGDGFSDIAVTALWFDQVFTNEGQVSVYHGRVGGVNSWASWQVTGAQNFCEFGKSVAAVGDINADGFGDLLIGAPQFDNGQVNEGRALLYFGGDSTLRRDAAWIGESDQDNSRMGFVVAGLGDVDNDGFPDVAVSAPEWDNGGLEDRGIVQVYYGNGSNNLNVNLRQVRAQTTIPVVPLSRSQSQNSITLRNTNRSFSGVSRVRAQFEVKPIANSFNGQGLSESAEGSTGLNGLDVQQTITGLNPIVSYKWRTRTAYRASSGALQPFSRWYHIGANSPNEADFSTGAACAISVNAGQDIELCSGSAAQIGNTALNFTPPVQYAWTPAVGLSAANIATPVARPDATTTYIVAASDANGCVVRDTITVVVNPAVSVRSTSSRDTICAGDTVNLNASVVGGTEPYRYTWSPNSAISATNIAAPRARPLETIRYFTNVADAKGCTSRDTVDVVVVPLPFRPIIIRRGDSLLSQVVASSYQWFRNGTAIAGATGPGFLMPAGDRSNAYTVAVFNRLGCSVTSDAFISTSADEIWTSDGVEVVPNPARGRVTVSDAAFVAEGDVVITLINVQGEQVASFAGSVGRRGLTTELDLTGLASGVYTIMISGGNQPRFAKVVVQ